MIIGDFDIERIAVHEAKAHTPLIVDPDRMLASPVAFQQLKTVRWRHAQVVSRHRAAAAALPHA
jgi:hypothetical protein